MPSEHFGHFMYQRELFICKSNEHKLFIKGTFINNLPKATKLLKVNNLIVTNSDK